MPPTPEASRAAGLRDALRRLPVVIEEVVCEVGEVPLALYPESARPTSLVMARGRGFTGSGENVAWTEAEHEKFRQRVEGIHRGRWVLERWTAVLADADFTPYERAALEAAVIDLALRQARTNLFAMAGVTPQPVRYVVSFATVAHAAAERSGVELKVDVEVPWNDSAYAGLERVAVLDFKLSGTVADHERAHRAFPEAWIEDPRPGGGSWSEGLRRRVSFDAPVTATAALARLPVRPGAVNVKPARMGGVFEALDCVARCAADGIEVYVGGMWEVSVGRAQLRALAAVLCPEAPNDIAPIPVVGLTSARPARLPINADRPGFGSEE